MTSRALLLALLSGCATAPPPLRVVAAGDLALGPRATEDPLAALQQSFAGDVRFANLESPLTDRGEERGLDGEGRPLAPGARQVRLVAPPARAAWLRGRLDVASLANNHALDQGEAGRADTERHLATSSVAAAVQEAKLLRRGRTVTVVARELGPDLAPGDLLAAVAAARRRGPVLVSLHWGRTGSHLPSEPQRRLARQIIDAGAVAVLGHGPHTVMGVERHRRGVIAYSLGNLAFDCRCTEVRDAFLLAFTVDAQGAAADVTLLPIEAGIGAAPARPSTDAGLYDLLEELSTSLGATVERAGDRLRITGP